MTIPNIITTLRLVCVPFVIWLSYSTGTRGLAAAAGLFTFAAVTDWLDGYLARRSGAVSAFGTLMDPLVDKALILGVLFVFSDRDLLPLWLILLSMFRELLVTALRHSVSSPGRAVGANWTGKAKLCTQVVVVEIVYLHLLLGSVGGRLPGGVSLLFWAAVAMTLLSYLSLLSYVWGPRSFRAQAREGRPPAAR